jgi:hypothetical protein
MKSDSVAISHIS